MTECICEVEPVKATWHHDPDCRKWAPPPTGRGSSEEARRQAREALTAALNAAKARRKESA